MKSKHKALLLSMCAVLLVAATTFGTLAYLTDSEAVKNTFTVGSVYLKLDEAEVNLDGTLKSNKRVQENKYHLLPGHTYIKDPTVTVIGGSEDAYVRVKVNVTDYYKLSQALPASYKDANGLILLQYLCEGWDAKEWKFEGATPNKVSNGVTTEMTYEFWYKDKVEKAAADTTLDALFGAITIPDELDNDDMDLIKNVTINVTAQAIQASGFDDAEDAWDNFPVTVD